MAQKMSPFVEAKWGWDFGESGWNVGMDENLLKFSFLLRAVVDSIVNTLPAGVEGRGYYLTTDNRFYYFVGGVYYSSPAPDGFYFKNLEDQKFYQISGTSALEVLDNVELTSIVEANSQAVQGLGSAAYNDSEVFATALQGVKAETALQPGSNISSLNNDADFVSIPLISGTGGASLVGFGATNVDFALSDVISRKYRYTAALDVINASSTAGAAYKDGPRLLETNSGKVMAFYRVGNSHVENTGYLVYNVFNKDTKSWGNPIILDDDPLYDTRNQMAGCDPVTGRVFCFYSVREVPDSANRWTYFKYSDDDGVTWSTRQNLGQYCPYPSQPNIPFGKLISFSSGKLLITLYNYLTIFTLSSSDGGLTWGTTSATEPNPNPNVVTMYSGAVAGGQANITEPTIVKINDLFLVAVCRCYPLGTEVNGTETVQYIGKTWTASTTYLTGEYSYNAGRLYYASTGGISGSTAPSHTTGSATDGSVTWTVAGTPTVWAANTAHVLNQLLVVASDRVYKVTVAGTSGSTAPVGTQLADNENQLAYFKSSDGGATWSAPVKVTWTAQPKNVSTSPPCAVMVDPDTVEIAWAARYPDFNTYRVRMQARAFFSNPSWAFSNTDGEPRNRIWQAIPAITNSKKHDIDFGYIDLLPLSWATGVMAAWYDNPTLSSTRTDTYFTMINL